MQVECMCWNQTSDAQVYLQAGILQKNNSSNSLCKTLMVCTFLYYLKLKAGISWIDKKMCIVATRITHWNVLENNRARLSCLPASVWDLWWSSVDDHQRARWDAIKWAAEAGHRSLKTPAGLEPTPEQPVLPPIKDGVIVGGSYGCTRRFSREVAGLYKRRVCAQFCIKSSESIYKRLR